MQQVPYRMLQPAPFISAMRSGLELLKPLQTGGNQRDAVIVEAVISGHDDQLAALAARAFKALGNATVGWHVGLFSRDDQNRSRCQGCCTTAQIECLVVCQHLVGKCCGCSGERTHISGVR